MEDAPIFKEIFIVNDFPYLGLPKCACKIVLKYVRLPPSEESAIDNPVLIPR